MTKRNLNDVYLEYKAQIDLLANVRGMTYRKLAKVTAWFYGGSEESWRRILADKTRKTKISREVTDLLTEITKEK